MNQKTFVILGFSNLKSYLTKYFLPLFLIDVIFLIIFLFGFEDNTLKSIGVLVFIFILFFILFYPVILIENQTKNITEDLHYFITYAGALSTINLSRKDFFKDLSEKTRYKEISKIFKKLVYLVESVKIDFSTAAYQTASVLNSEHFARFLERMGIDLSFNSNAKNFFKTEQKVLMNAYTNLYSEGLERIKVIREIYISLILAYAFVLSTLMLLPFLTGLSRKDFLVFGILGILIIEGFIILFANYFLQKDPLYHSLGYETSRKKGLLIFGICLFISFILFFLVSLLDMIIMLKIAIITTPLLFVGLYSNYEEKKIRTRDSLFPSFIRSLGDVHQAKGGTLTSTLETLIPHNFSVLNDIIGKAYKRLKMTENKVLSWYYFSKESGSALIYEFTEIFTTVVYKGGSSQVAGEIVSKNMTRINGLREQKKEFTGTVRGGIYGSFVGLGITLYLSILVSILLFDIFGTLSSNPEEQISGDLIGSLFNTDKIEIESYATTSLFVAVILAIHAIMSSYILKIIDGGNPLGMFSDIVFLFWIGAILEFVLIFAFKYSFGVDTI